MAKRFTDTNKYRKPFIRGLQGAYKLLWDYLYHDCDHAGIWIVDFEIAQLYIGSDMPVNKSDALKYFNSDEKRIIEIDGGKKWFLPSFIEFQYGVLSENNRAHSSVISILKKYGLYKNKPLTSPLQGAKDKDKEMDIVKDMVKELNLDEKFINLISIWLKYKSEKNQSYKPTGLKEMIKKLAKLSNGDFIKAELIIKDSISNNYSGFFKLKTENVPEFNGISFYESELKKCNNDNDYKLFVEFLNGRNILNRKLINLLSVSEPISFEQLKIVIQKTKGTKIKISELLIEIENDLMKNEKLKKSALFVLLDKKIEYKLK